MKKVNIKSLDGFYQMGLQMNHIDYCKHPHTIAHGLIRSDASRIFYQLSK